METVKQRRWENQYIARAGNSDFIYSPDQDGKITGPQRAALEQLCRDYERVVVELCSGSGMFLLALANRSPRTLHLGFELRFKRAVRNAEKAKEQALRNLRICRTDARQILELFPESSLDGVCVNFPDPWIKRKQRKHRLLNPEFINTISKLIKPGGFFLHKGDHLEYFNSVVEALRALPEMSITEFSTDLYASEYAHRNVPTEFERLFNNQGTPINYLLATKKALVAA